METSTDLAQFIGRLHVVLVHLPIGCLALLGALELLSMVPKWRHSTLSNRFVLALTAPLAVLTAVCGWLLAESGGYEARLLFLHLWTGVGVAVAACLLYWFHARGWLGFYRAGVFATLALTMVAGHYGGSLTHGSDYLTRHAPDWIGGGSGKSDLSGAGGEGFASVEPILTEYCISCHGPEKSKGGLRLDTLSSVLEGGDSGAVMVAGNPSASLLLKRMLLPLEDDDHMPPEGKPQPASRDVEQLRMWIETGAVE